MSSRVVIVGGGLAGQRCAESLRRGGHEGQIVMLCAEHHRPYDRPPLSKEMLLDPSAQQPPSFRSADWYSEQQVELMLGERAVGLDTAARTLSTSGGRHLAWEDLLIATGSTPRTLPELERYENVSTLRDVEDARTLANALRPGARLLIIGAGFIGQEAASAACAAGAEAVIVEAGRAPLAGILGAEVGSWFSQMHRARGVEVICDEHVAQVHGGDRVHAVTLAGGRRVQCDHVLVGIGVAPSLDWLAGTPLASGCVLTDADGRTGIPGIYAAGDAAASPHPVTGEHVPGNHWESAARQGARAARSMLGLDAGEVSPSSFWSDLHGVRIQYVGHARGADAVQLDGDPLASNYTATFTKGGRPVAVLLAGRPEQLPQARQLLSNATG